MSEREHESAAHHIIISYHPLVSWSVSQSVNRSVGSKQEKRPSKVKRMKDSGEEEGSCVSTYRLQCIRPSVMTNEWCHAESVESSSMSERA